MDFYEITLQSSPTIVFAHNVDTLKHKNFFDHKPDFLEISLCEAGRILAENLDGTRSILCPGMLGMITSDSAANTYAHNGERQKHTTVAVRMKYDLQKHSSARCDIPALRQRMAAGRTALLPIREYMEDSYGGILNLLKKIVALHAANTPVDALGAIALWYQLLAAVTEFTLQKLDTAESAVSPSERAYAAKAERYINRHYAESLTVGSIAQELGISEGYLHRVFKATAGCSVLEYLNRKRVTVAIDLVDNRGLSLKDAAYNVGIEDPAYMSRLFKKVTGLSFREYFREKRVSSHF